MLKARLKEAKKSKTRYQLSETDMNPDLLAFRLICIPLHYATLPLTSSMITRNSFIMICYTSEYGDLDKYYWYL